MFKVNDNYLKLPGSYLFSTIGKKVAAYTAANPDKEVILFVGDGGFQMTNQELAILNIYKVSIKVVMLNNHSLGMVRQWQESFYEGRTSESVLMLFLIFK